MFSFLASKSPAVADADGQAPTKKAKHAASEGETKNQGRINRILIQNALAQGYLLRMLVAAVFDIVAIRADHPVVLAMKAEGTAYHQATKGKKGHGLGSPGPHIWIRVLTELLSSTSDFPKMQQLKESIAKFETLVTVPNSKEKTFDNISEYIRVCRQKAVHMKKDKPTAGAAASSGDNSQVPMVNIQLAYRGKGEEITTMVIEFLTHEGGVKRRGIAPPSYNENQLQRLMDSISDKKDDDQ